MGDIHQHTFANGLVLVAEPIAHAQSLAMSLLLPAGVASEADDKQGAAAILAEMICRGAGNLDAKGHSNALDQLGVQRAPDVATYHLCLGATMIGRKLDEALPLLVDMIRRPMLSEEALGPSRDLALQGLDALEDEPQQKVFLQLKHRHLPQPLGRSAMGVRKHIESIQLKDVRAHWEKFFVPGGAVLAFAGRFDWDHLKDKVESLLGDWQGQAPQIAIEDDAAGGYHHIKADTSQVHIGLMYDALAETDKRSMLCRAAVAVLSGGMSGRLFTEVREKRGLCYAVYAAYGGQKDRGVVVSYAGTTTARAQETLNVLAAEHVRLSDGVQTDEFDRAIVGMKSRLVMQGESTGARAHAIAADQYLFGQPRTLDQLTDEVDGVTVQMLCDFLAAHRPDAMTIVTIGPEPLRVNHTV